MTQALRELSWTQLIDQLHDLQRQDSPSSASPERLAHELEVHQVELELQNRELRETQGDLEASRARYAELYDRAPVGYVGIDAFGLIIDINLTAVALIGAERDRVLGVPFAVATGVVDRREFLAALHATGRTNRLSTRDFVFQTPRGRLVLQMTLARDVSHQGLLQGYRISLMDVTEQRRAATAREAAEDERRAREDAEAANRMKDQFLGIVSHELRTPLNAMMGWTQIIESRQGDPELLKRGLSAMRRNGRTLTRLVDDMLDVSRIINGKLYVERTKVEVEDLVRAAIEEARPAAESKHVTLVENVSRGCVVMGDAVRLQQVAGNLLSNAIKFTSEGGRVEVSLKCAAGTIKLTVRDDGCGIEAKDLPLIFEYFRQADSSHTRTHSGLGLGLAIARHIVEAHDGTIRAFSDGKGKGAVFAVELLSPPFSSPPPPVSASARERADTRRIVGVPILCVDDDVDGLEVLAIMLESLGAVVRTAPSVDAAIQILEDFAPELVVSDIAMPYRDGYDLVRHIRAMSGSISKIPVIALSAFARPGDAEEALQAKFTRHVKKPVEIDAICDMVVDLINDSAPLSVRR